MTAVFVHGVADTYRIWEPVRQQLDREDTLALALPGFDSPIPAGFTATKEEYVDWIIAELEKLPGPIDLVGHDWGCIFTARVASLRPDLIRTWAGGSGPISRSYEWHYLAKIWQAPDVGEKWMADFDRDSFKTVLIEDGVSPGTAQETIDLIDETMKDSILRLYRSAVNLGNDWEDGLSGSKSSNLIIWGARDPFTQISFGHKLGEAMNATNVIELDCGHYTLLQKPEEFARALIVHWTAADAKNTSLNN